MRTKKEQYEALQSIKDSYDGDQTAMQSIMNKMAVIIQDGVEGAWPNGTRVEKINSEIADIHQDRTLGTTTGAMWSHYVSEHFAPSDTKSNVQYMYLVDFDNCPMRAENPNALILLMDIKLKLVSSARRNIFINA